MANERLEVTIEDAKIIYKNFTGAKDQYNAEGDRNFAVILPPDVAAAMMADGWNVKERPPREEGDEPFFYIGVAVKYGEYPPRVIQHPSSGKAILHTADTVGQLDTAYITAADVVISGYRWTVNDKTGVKAYLKTMHCAIEESEIDQKWALVDAEAAGDI